MTVTANPTELIIKRVFTAPMELVYRAWTEYDLQIQWISPESFGTTFVEIDAQVGGQWKSGMLSPDGEEYIMFGTYQALEPYHRIVFSHSWVEENLPDHDPKVVTTVEINLRTVDEGTEMTFVQSGFTRHAASQGHGGGWSGAFDKLDRLTQIS